MYSMIIVLVAFISVFIAMFSVVFATTIRKLRKEVNNLKEENTKLKDENHSLSCSEKSLLGQRAQLREEIMALINDSKYYYGRQDLMHNNFRHVGLYDKKGMQQMSVRAAWEKAVKMIYNWS